MPVANVQMGYIEYPIHHRQYHLKTGRGTAGQEDCIAIYPVKLINNEIYIGFEENFYNRKLGVVVC